MASKNITFQDIADFTHFSKTTISRYFNNPDSLTEKNRKKIEDALDKLGYEENKIARILANGQTEYIGLLIPNMYLHFFSYVVDRLLHTYEKFGFKFLVFAGSADEEVERRYIRELLSYKIEGLIVLSHTIPSIELSSYHIPLVVMEREDRYVNSVNTDNHRGGRQAAEFLADKGCDLLIFVDSPTKENVPAYQRGIGFREVCAERRIEQISYECTMEPSYEEMNKSLHDITADIIDKYPNRKKGVFLTNDTSTNIMLNYLFNRFGRLPDDFRLIGFDDSPVSQFAVLPTSTIGQQVDEMIDAMMNMLIDEIAEYRANPRRTATEPKHETIAPVLIERAT